MNNRVYTKLAKKDVLSLVFTLQDASIRPYQAMKRFSIRFYHDRPFGSPNHKIRFYPPNSLMDVVIASILPQKTHRAVKHSGFELVEQTFLSAIFDLL